MKPALPSNRSFGWTFTGVFAPGAFFYPWVLALAALTALVTLIRAQWLAPLNRAWMKLGGLMHRAGMHAPHGQNHILELTHTLIGVELGRRLAAK